MDSVKISPKFQVVIPRKVREAMRLRPGQTMQVVQYGNRVELVPIVKLSKLRGMARGIDSAFSRDQDRL